MCLSTTGRPYRSMLPLLRVVKRPETTSCPFHSREGVIASHCVRLLCFPRSPLVPMFRDYTISIARISSSSATLEINALSKLRSAGSQAMGE